MNRLIALSLAIAPLLASCTKSNEKYAESIVIEVTTPTPRGEITRSDITISDADKIGVVVGCLTDFNDKSAHSNVAGGWMATAVMRIAYSDKSKREVVTDLKVWNESGKGDGDHPVDEKLGPLLAELFEQSGADPDLLAVLRKAGEY